VSKYSYIRLALEWQIESYWRNGCISASFSCVCFLHVGGGLAAARSPIRGALPSSYSIHALRLIPTGNRPGQTAGSVKTRNLSAEASTATYCDTESEQNIHICWEWGRHFCPSVRHRQVIYRIQTGRFIRRPSKMETCQKSTFPVALISVTFS
jgi:hypothetical protein